MDIPFDFGSVLRTIRIQKGYTQKRLAEILNVSVTTISKYESNTVVPPFETLRAIAKWFNVSLDTLAGNEPPLTVSLYGLSDNQAAIIKELVTMYNEKNCLVLNTLSSKKYELLGRIVESFV